MDRIELREIAERRDVQFGRRKIDWTGLDWGWTGYFGSESLGRMG